MDRYVRCALICMIMVLGGIAVAQISDVPVLEGASATSELQQDEELLVNVEGDTFTAGAMRLVLPRSSRPFVLQAGGLSLTGDFVEPQTEPNAAPAGIEHLRDCWSHRNRSIAVKNLAARPGQLVTDTFLALGSILHRQIWISADGSAFAVRLIYTNKNNNPVLLDSLLPLRCTGPASLSVAGGGAEKLDFLVQQRDKNGRPEVMSAGKVKDFEADQFVAVRNPDEPQGNVLIGYLSQFDHCARFLLDMGDDSMQSFTAECEFDGVVVPVGGSRTSQWVIVLTGPDIAELIADFADRVGRYHNIEKPPKNAPAVACSWYPYLGSDTEKDLDRDLAWLREHPIPFDVYLIEGSWWQNFGDWYADERWPSGMKAVGRKIRQAGYTPGMWTCPFLAEKDSRLVAEHPEWFCRKKDGSPCLFPMGRPLYVLDPTYPGVCEFLEQTFRRLVRDWDFPYQKLDFTRAVFVDKDIRFYDRSATRLQAYRMGLEAIRRGCGPDTFISMCGGHYGGSMGLVNAQRSGADVDAFWENVIVRFEQNLRRTWMGRLWLTNADSMMVRFRNDPRRTFTDEEAGTNAINQYLAGQLVKLSVYFEPLDDYTRALYRHIIPSVDSPAVVLDPFNPFIPSTMLTVIEPKCKDLKPWVAIALVNWTEEARNMSVGLNEKLATRLGGRRFLVSEFFTEKILGIYQAGQAVDIGRIEPHVSRLLRVTCWDGQTPVLAGTDLHFSGGGVEIAEWNVADKEVSGRIETMWRYPVRVTAAWPVGDSFLAKTVTLPAGQNEFHIPRP